MRTLLVLGAVLLTLGGPGCAEIPQRRYGLDDLRFKGVHQLDPEALRACLATQQRNKLTLTLAALRSPKCGQPPFDNARAQKRLFAWGWTDWPVYDAAVLRLDLDRISRWYRARGYYGVRILEVRYDPPEAKERDESAQCPEGCPLDITVVVQEGSPVRIRQVRVLGHEKLTADVQERLLKAVKLEPGEVFDEALYDAAKKRVAKVLREYGYARAKIEGDVVIGRTAQAADVTLQVIPGPVCRIGKVRVRSTEAVPTGPILAMTLLRPNQVYRESELDDAQRAVYSLGAFAAVSVHGDLDTGAEEIVDVVIEVEPRRKSQVQLGAGIMSGVLATSAAATEQYSVPQWDVHLLGTYEHRNFIGGLRRFRVEDRPRLMFLDPFPSVIHTPRFGNLFNASFVQPGVFEPRTNLFLEARHDYGPDPFQLFFRNDLGLALGLERRFWQHQLTLRGALQQDFMLVSKRQPVLREEFPAEITPENTPLEERPEGGCVPYDEDPIPGRETCQRTYDEVLPGTYYLPFLAQRVTLDLRDSPTQPTRGLFISLSLQEAVRIEPRSWNYVRVLPDFRAYVPLGLGLVLAGRFALGAVFIFDASSGLDEDQQKLGPQSYRLRGGGAQSNRGFLPGELGDSRRGGIRSWESSLELRIPLFKDVSLVGFADVGDVHGSLTGPSRFRFSHLNTAVGGGLRYRTIVGPIRLDVGYRPNALQRTDGSEPERDQTNLGFTKFRGAIHLTIGEAF